MKITVRNDESAALLPSEVKIRQQASEYARERNRQWQQCASQVPVVNAFNVPLAAVWPESRGGK